MEQDQFRVSFSLRAKLLLSVVILLLTVILFLTLSSYTLFKEDKVAYVYQLQSKEAFLAGKEFINSASRAVDTLRQSLAALDPMRGNVLKKDYDLKTLVENQSLLVGFRLVALNTQDKSQKIITQNINKSVLERTGLAESDIQIRPEWIAVAIPELKENSISFFNLSKVGKTPLVGIALADNSQKNNPKGFPISVGFLPLDLFLNDFPVSNFTIVNSTGWILYDSNPTRMFDQNDMSTHPLYKTAMEAKATGGAKEFSLDETLYLGSFHKPGLGLIALSQSKLDDEMRATYTLSVKFALLGVMAIGGAIIFAIFFAKTLTAPLNKLYDATREVAGGKFDLRLDSSTNDEIGALSTSFNLMSNKISALIKESMEKVRLEGELAIASTVQQTLIPPDKFKNDQLLIKSYYESASECGGDWWGFFTHQNKAVILIADATGHGMPSALVTASARSCFSVIHMMAQEFPEFSFSPRNMLSYANRAIYECASGKIMMTFFAAVIDFTEMKLTYSSAGHNPPWLFRKKPDGGYDLRSLTAKGIRLGEKPDLKDFEEHTTDLQPEDLLFLYTDGITEGKNKLGAMFGKKALRKVVENSLVGGPELVIANISKEFKKHNEGKPLDDDITLAAAQILSL